MKRVLLGMLLVACPREPAPAPAATPSATVAIGPPSSTSPAPPMTAKPPLMRYELIIRTPEEVRKHVGEVITIEGVVQNSKWPTLLGVDMPDTDSENRDVRNRKYRVTGLLETWKEEWPANGAAVQGRGPNAVHYVLKRADGADGPVELVPIP